MVNFNNFYISLLTGMLVLAHCPSLAGSLDEFRWQYRPLVMFAPNSDDVRLQQIQNALSSQDCELTDRHMKIVIVLGEGNGSYDGEPLSPQYAKQLRTRFEVTANDFAVLLIGKDGGEKYRSETPPDLSRIYALIDGMPMRIDEMNSNPVDCSTPVN